MAGILDSTISKVVKAGRENDLRHGNLFFRVSQVDKNGFKRIYSIESIIDKYRDVLEQDLIEYEFDLKEIEKYRYKPRSFCLDYYNNADLWSALLRINNMMTAIDFKKTKIKTFGPKFIRSLENLMSIEYDMIEKNRRATEE